MPSPRQVVIRLIQEGVHYLMSFIPFQAQILGSIHISLPLVVNSGLILQWGKWAAATATGWIAFPIVFPTAKPMLASNIEANANTYAVANMFPYDVTTSGFQRTVSSPDRRCTYIAIGR